MHQCLWADEGSLRSLGQKDPWYPKTWQLVVAEFFFQVPLYHITISLGEISGMEEKENISSGHLLMKGLLIDPSCRWLSGSADVFRKIPVWPRGGISFSVQRLLLNWGSEMLGMGCPFGWRRYIKHPVAVLSLQS